MPAMVMVASLPTTCAATIRTDSGITGLTLPGMIELPGWRLGMVISPMPQRDLFADFARMRREMDQMMGDSWSRTRYVSRRASGFSPNVDVYYVDEPQRAVVKVDLAGVDLTEVGIEVSGRQLAIVGRRVLQETEGRVYQQIEIPSGPFRRVVELQAEVDPNRSVANYEDGILTVELPLREPGATTTRVPIERP